MKIAIFHYHLKKGGVTTVIKEQVQALQPEHDVLVITGESPEEFIHDKVMILPELGYGESGGSPETITLKLIATMHRYFGTRCDVFHFHNPILAKNCHLFQVICMLAQQGIHIFLQVHDFAEDGRPGAYAKADYPENVHYGVINQRDYGFLLKSGLNEQGLHYIPNAMHAAAADPISSEKGQMLLYPVRAIRRKNIGEILLSSLFLKEHDYIGITLPALNVNDIKSYQDWKYFASTHGLKVEFDLGLRYDFSDLVSRSKCFINTSITEGFGYVFLDPWINHKFLLGRIIPDTCADFQKNGIDLSYLYEKLLIPLHLIDKEYFLSKIKADLENAEKYFGSVFHKEALLAYFHDLVKREFLDFAILSERMQADLILKILNSRQLKTQLAEINKKLPLLASDAFDEPVMKKNVAFINQYYSQADYQHRLTAIYEKVVATPVTQKIDKGRLLSFFSNPAQFSLLKWGAYDG